MEPDKTPTHQKSEPHPRKIQCVKRNDAGDTAAGADAWCLRSWIKSDMRQVTDEYRQCNERQITHWPQKIFHGMSKCQEEIHVAYKVNNACVQKERCNKGDRKSTRLNSSHTDISRMPSSA